jgi:hypothetical protein
MGERHEDVKFEFMADMLVKNYVLQDITLCTLLEVYRRFEGLYRVHLPG